MKTPPNVAYLAAELAVLTPKMPHKAAFDAAQLCHLGRCYKAVSERLCGGEDVWGRYPEAGERMAKAEKRRANILARIEQYATFYRSAADTSGSGIIVVFRVPRNGHKVTEQFTETALL